MICEHGNDLADSSRPFPQGQTSACFLCWKAARRAPARNFSLPCIHEGAILSFCPAGDESLHVRDCDKDHPDMTRQKCQSCDDYDSGLRRIDFHLSAEGIGDAVCGYYAACGAADAGYAVTFYAKHRGWLSCASHPGVTIAVHDAIGPDADRDYGGKLRASADGSCPSGAQWYADNIAAGHGIPKFKPSRPKSIAAYATVIEPGYTVLAPFSLHGSREWPAAKWSELADRLRSEGKRVVGIDGSGDGGRLTSILGGNSAASWYWGNSPEWTLALIANSDLFIGNDSGMAHVAGLLGVKARAVMTHLPPEYVFAEAPTVRGVGAEGYFCQGCSWQGSAGYQNDCNRRCAALDSIGVDRVYGAVELPKTTAEVLALAESKLTWHRKESLPWLLREIESRFPDPRIVETGCVRSREDWSAGYATWLLGAILESFGRGSVVAVDIDPKHCGIARRLCKPWPRVSVVESCSAAYLRGRTEPIDVAYLDSMDTYVEGHAEHGLAEAQAVEPLMSPKGIIAFDDTPAEGDGWTGKGRLAVPWLISQGWRVLPVSGYQTLLTR